MTEGGWGGEAAARGTGAASEEEDEEGGGRPKGRGAPWRGRRDGSLGGARCTPPPPPPLSPPIAETPRPQARTVTAPPAAPRPRAGDSPMALAGGGAAAAADAGLRLAARPPALPPSAAAAPSGPPPPPRAPPASQPGGDSPTPPTPIPPRGRGPSAHSAYALPRPHGLSGSTTAAASACSSSFSLAASAQLLTRSPPASPSTQRLPVQPLHPARSPRLSPAPPSPGSSRCYFLPRRDGEQRDRSEAILEPGARCGSAKAARRAGRALPGTKMAAGIDAGGEARAPFLPRAGAVLGAALIRAGPHALRRARAIAPPVAAHAGGVGRGRLESRTGMGRASQALSRPYP